MKGAEYSGNISVTVEGYECLLWSNQNPQWFHDYDFPENDINAVRNLCRNPNNKPEGPWCYTTEPGVQAAYCAIPMCRASEKINRTNTSECINTKDGGKYTGTLSKDVYGLPCEHWSYVRDRLDRTLQDEDFPDGSVEAAFNYCRNPNNAISGICYFCQKPSQANIGIWCYTWSKGWLLPSYCSAPLCQNITLNREQCTTDRKGARGM